jgi:hypothetical protein
MQRIYAPVDDSTLDQIDQDVKEKDIGRAQWVSTAIDTYLQLADQMVMQIHRNCTKK